MLKLIIFVKSYRRERLYLPLKARNFEKYKYFKTVQFNSYYKKKKRQVFRRSGWKLFDRQEANGQPDWQLPTHNIWYHWWTNDPRSLYNIPMLFLLNVTINNIWQKGQTVQVKRYKYLTSIRPNIRKKIFKKKDLTNLVISSIDGFIYINNVSKQKKSRD